MLQCGFGGGLEDVMCCSCIPTVQFGTTTLRSISCQTFGSARSCSTGRSGVNGRAGSRGRSFVISEAARNSAPWPSCFAHSDRSSGSGNRFATGSTGEEAFSNRHRPNSFRRLGSNRRNGIRDNAAGCSCSSQRRSVPGRSPPSGGPTSGIGFVGGGSGDGSGNGTGGGGFGSGRGSLSWAMIPPEYLLEAN